MQILRQDGIDVIVGVNQLVVDADLGAAAVCDVADARTDDESGDSGGEGAVGGAISARRRASKRGILRPMKAHKIRVEDGRIKLDEPTDLPNGTELYVAPNDVTGQIVVLPLSREHRERLAGSRSSG